MTVANVIPSITFPGASGPGTMGPFSLVKNGTPLVFYSNAHVKVWRYESEDDTAPVLLVEGTDYDLSGGPSAGSITLTAPQTGLLTAERLHVRLEQPFSQNLDLDTMRFSRENIEQRFDVLTLMLQELARETKRTIRYSLFDTDEIPSTLPLGAALGKIAYATGTTENPFLALLDVASLSGLVALTDEDKANLSIVAADLSGADTIGTVAALKDDIEDVAGSLTDIEDTAEWIRDGQFDSAPVIATGTTEQKTLADRFAETPIRRNTYAALTAIPASARLDDMEVYVASRSTDGDGGGGFWRFDASSSATANGGTILAPDAGAGRWIRQYTEGVRPEWFGAVADGASVVTAALQAAFTAAGVNGLVTLRPVNSVRTYLTAQVIPPAGLTVKADGFAVLKMAPNNNKSIINARASDGCTFEGFAFDCNPTENTGSPSAGEMHGGIDFDSNTTIRGCTFYGMRSYGYLGYGDDNLIEQNRFIVGPYGAYAYADDENVAGMIFSTDGVFRNRVYDNVSDGIQYGLSIWGIDPGIGADNEMKRNTAYGLTGTDLDIVPRAACSIWRCRRSQIENNKAYNCQPSAVMVIGYSDGTQIVGNHAVACGLAGLPGIDVGDSAGYLDRNLVISSNVSIDCGGPGFWFTSVYNSTIIGNTSFSNGNDFSPERPGWSTNFYKAGFVVASEGDDPATPFANNTIVGNVARGNTYGISRTGSASGVIVSNVVSGNDFSGNASGALNIGSNTNIYIGNNGNGDLLPAMTAGKAWGAGDGAIAMKLVNTSTGEELVLGFDNSFATDSGIVIRSSGTIGFAPNSTSTDLSNARTTLIQDDGDIAQLVNGKGIICKSPDGTQTLRIGISNAGAVVATTP